MGILIYENVQTIFRKTAPEALTDACEDNAFAPASLRFFVANDLHFANRSPRKASVYSEMIEEVNDCLRIRNPDCLIAMGFFSAICG